MSVFDLIDEGNETVTTSLIAKETPPSMFTISPLSRDLSPHTTSTSATLSDPIPFDTQIGTEDMEVDSSVQLAMMFLEGESNTTSIY